MDDVFAHLDRCVTSAGQVALYRRLRFPSTERSDIAAFDRKVRSFDEDVEQRDAVERALRPLRRTTTLALAPILHAEAPSLGRAARWGTLAPFATLLAGALALVWPFALVFMLAVVVGNIAVRLRFHEMMSAQALALASIADLIVAARNLACSKAAAFDAEIASLQGALADVAGFRNVIGWLTLEALDMNELAASIVTYVNVVFALDVHAFVRSIALVRDHAASLRTLLETTGEMDAARAVADYRAGSPTCVPSFGERGTRLEIDGVRHPLVEDPVPNDLHLHASEGWLVLGSNMAGKSTYLRAVATSSILAQSIASVPARRYRGPLLTVRTLMHMQDDVTARRSHFLAEAEASRELLDDDDHGVDGLCVVDELFRGTNTADRIAAGSAFLRGLRRRGKLVLAATHDAELLTVLANEYRASYFTECVDGGRLSFDYRLRVGAHAPRNALAVLKLVGFPDDVLEDARRLAPT